MSEFMACCAINWKFYRGVRINSHCMGQPLLPLVPPLDTSTTLAASPFSLLQLTRGGGSYTAVAPPYAQHPTSLCSTSTSSLPEMIWTSIVYLMRDDGWCHLIVLLSNVYATYYLYWELLWLIYVLWKHIYVLLSYMVIWKHMYEYMVL